VALVRVQQLRDRQPYAACRARLARCGFDCPPGDRLRAHFGASAGPYIGLAVIVAKLVIVYAVFLLQSRTIEIYEYYGGKLVNGIWPLLAAFYVGDRLLQGLPVLLQLTLS
jgi:hypothetical protein